MEYKINKVNPCADYEGYTTEIIMSEEFNELFIKRALFNIMDHVDYYDIAKIIVADYGIRKIYIYDNKRIIIVQANSVNDANNIIKLILKEYYKQKELFV